MAVDIPKLDPFVDWLADNILDVREGTASYRGTPVTLETRVRQFRSVVSLFFFTTVTPSRLQIDGRPGHLAVGFECTMHSLLCGWWGFPWGPVFTVAHVIRNVFGGSTDSVGNLIDEIAGHQRTVLRLTEAGADLARQRIAEQGYPRETALLIRFHPKANPEHQVLFDVPESDGRQWCSVSQGIVVLVEKEQEATLEGLSIDAEDGEFVFRRDVSPDGFFDDACACACDEDDTRAIEYYTMALKLDPRFPQALFNRGTHWEELGHHARAVADYRSTLEFWPSDATTHDHLARILIDPSNEQCADLDAGYDHALRACQITEFRKAEYLETLAAACIQRGEIGNGIARQEAAIAAASQPPTPEMTELERSDLAQSGLRVPTMRAVLAKYRQLVE